ncbi:hypothetical protein ASZ90_007262 [hydrocarbon metagenome]|uniref:Uncharacterized protein n=1 Tax=hydrocarbon metagenome TaxID=938273 RepID=A0A0W8FPV8_9ZZZZ
MDGIVKRKYSKEEKKIFLFLTYFFSSIAFFPLSFTLWYLLNKKRFSFYYPAIACLIILGFSFLSYLYVLSPLTKYHLNVGVWCSIVYGGALAGSFYLNRFTYPVHTSRIFFILYYLSYSLIIINLTLLMVIPRYFLVNGIDGISIMLIILGLAWIGFAVFINTVFTPQEEGVADETIKNEGLKFLPALIVTLGTFILPWVAYVGCKLIILPK